MRRGFGRVKRLPSEIRKGLSSSQDLGERCVVVARGFGPGIGRLIAQSRADQESFAAGNDGAADPF